MSAFHSRTHRLISMAGLVLGWATLLCSGNPVSAGVFEIEPEEGNQVVFESSAPLETFEGKTERVQGFVLIDPAQPSDSIEVRVEVDLASLDTGNGLRNRHMRENHLQTDQYPKAFFRGARLKGTIPPALPPGETVKLLASGVFEIHGVSRPLEIPVEMTFLAAGDSSRARLRVSGRFEVTLSDYNIDRPGFLMMKLGETQEVTFDVVAILKGEGSAP